MSHRLNCRRSRVSYLAIIVAAVAFSPLSANAQVANLKVMSFNIRVGSANDGNNSWNNPNGGVDRKDLVVTSVKSFNPDILGLQEDLDYQGNYVRNETDGAYTMFRRGANADGSGEQVAILYRTDRFTRLRQGSFWLSPTPSTAGSEFGSADFPRIVNWLELSDNLNSGYRFVVMNTHWDQGGADAKNTVRLKSAALMREKMTEIAPTLPMIFTGDFNADEGSDPYRRLTSRDEFVETPVDESRFLIDTYRNKHSDSATVGTAPGFDGVGGTGRIDWILHTDLNFTTISSNIDRTSYSGRYASDHFPINAVIAPIPEPASLALIATAGLGLMRRRSRAK